MASGLRRRGPGNNVNLEQPVCDPGAKTTLHQSARGAHQTQNKVEPEIAEVADLIDIGGWTRTSDLQIMSQFTDSENKEKMASDLSNWFNEVAARVGTAQIDLETLRDNLQSEIDRRISIWVHLARAEALSLFGTEKETHDAMEQSLLLFKSNCGETSDNVDP